MKNRILIIDDESAIRNFLNASLNAQFQIFEAASGRDGLEQVAATHPHLILLDLGLPDLPGIDVLKRLREWTKIPVIVLTVSDEEELKVQLLDAGADDYLTKPFSLPELMARIRVALRNHNEEHATPVFVSDDLEIDLNLKTVKRQGESIKLSATEFNLISLLVRSRGRVVKQSQLLTEVWGPDAADRSHYLRIYIGQIRKKIEVDAAAPLHILTEPGVGYLIK